LLASAGSASVGAYSAGASAPACADHGPRADSRPRERDLDGVHETRADVCVSLKRVSLSGDGAAPLLPPSLRACRRRLRTSRTRATGGTTRCTGRARLRGGECSHRSAWSTRAVGSTAAVSARKRVRAAGRELHESRSPDTEPRPRAAARCRARARARDGAYVSSSRWIVDAKTVCESGEELVGARVKDDGASADEERVSERRAGAAVSTQ
jgi:hypothetical protein